MRFFFSGATESEFDKQGRITIPQNLRDYSKIGKDVTVIGVSNQVEIWSTELWNEYMSIAEESYEEI